jgi:hypothetical protein
VFGVFSRKREAEEVGSFAQKEWKKCWVAVSEIQVSSS